MASCVSTFAGDEADANSVSSLVDGTGSAAHFYAPTMLTEHGGDLYVCDSENHAVRKITVPGAVVTRFAGDSAGASGSADGDALTAATFSTLGGIGFDTSGVCYLADLGNTIRKIAAGTVSTLAGTAATSGHVDATGAAARFDSPNGIAVDASGNVYTCDTLAETVRKITPAGVVTTVAGTAYSSGTADGDALTTARFWTPSDCKFGTDGLLYICDESNNAIRAVDLAASTVTTVATGISLPAAMCPYGDDFLVASIDNQIWRVTTAGTVTLFAGNGTSGLVNGPPLSAEFNQPLGVWFYGDSVYIGDNLNNVIRRVGPCPGGRPRMRGRHVPHPVRIRGREKGVNPAAPRMRGRQAT